MEIIMAAEEGKERKEEGKEGNFLLSQKLNGEDRPTHCLVFVDYCRSGHK